MMKVNSEFLFNLVSDDLFRIVLLPPDGDIVVIELPTYFWMGGNLFTGHSDLMVYSVGYS